MYSLTSRCLLCYATVLPSRTFYTALHSSVLHRGEAVDFEMGIVMGSLWGGAVALKYVRFRSFAVSQYVQ